MDFGSTLKILRLASNTSIRTLAKKMGVSPAFLSQLENGKSSAPSHRRIAQMENLLKLPSGYLYHVSNRQRSSLGDSAAETDPAESMEFLEASRAAKMKAQDFSDLSEVMLQGDLPWLRKVLRSRIRSRAVGKSSASAPGKA